MVRVQQVFDCRQVTTTSGMFEALCNHIKYSTNKGNIRWVFEYYIIFIDIVSGCCASQNRNPLIEELVFPFKSKPSSFL